MDRLEPLASESPETTSIPIISSTESIRKIHRSSNWDPGGTYQLRLTVTDRTGDSSTSAVTLRY
jgi:hypothetical protein